jgi:hypothetical protein
MHRGYTKRWRKMWDSDYHQDHLLFVMMSYFIDHAAWKRSKVYKKGVGMVEIQRGECAYSIRELAHTLKSTPRKIRTRISTLQTIGFLTQQTTRHCTIASVINYDTYNATENENDTPTDTHATHGRHTVDTPINSKEGKKVRRKEKKEKNIKKRKTRIPPEWKLTESLMAYAKGKGLNGNVGEIAEDFVLYYKKNGREFIDWDAAFKSWIRKHIEIHPNSVAHPQISQPPIEDLMS